MKNEYILTILVIFISVLLIIIGLVFGDIEDGILKKAIIICYECIGIG